MVRDDFMELPYRKSPRISGYDYSTANYYFITICTDQKRCIFGDPGTLNWIGKCAEEHLYQIAVLNPDISIDKYVIMPNHIHIIFDVRDCRNQKDLAIVIGQYKMSVTKEIRKVIPNFQVWQRSFHDHVIRNQRSYEKIWMYIESNPFQWREDCFYIPMEKDEA